MNRPDHEPLSPEERALADRLARLGALDGPSSALDAKILAAAHAAVAPPSRRRRWLGLSAIPGGLITGAGMAAALVVVVGVVWQLRPADPLPRSASGDDEVGYVSAQIIERPQAVVAPPPPPPVDATVARALNPPAQRRAPAAREIAPAVASAPAPASPPAPKANATVGPDEHRHYLDEAVGQASATAAYSAAPAAAAPGAVMAAPAPAPVAAEAAVAEQQDAARHEAFGLAKARQQERSDDQAGAARSRAAATASTESQTTLDRIEVSGSRIRADAPITGAALKDVPVGADAELDAKAWLERIRARRDAGDLDGAHESLTRFREVHPRVRVPRDLRALAKPPATR